MIIKEDVISGIIKQILEMRKKFKNIIVIAHNGQDFDHQFILNYILQNTSLKPKLIMRGTKIILMQLDNMKFIDSLNYFPMPLSKLPKAFGLRTSLKKGYFPHLFNKAEVRPIPAIEYYKPNTMKMDGREVFLKWYADNKNTEFNMQ